jgi:hypothetical protein
MFNNPLAENLYQVGDMSEIVITQCHGLPVLALKDEAEPDGLLHLHNIGTIELAFIEMDANDVKTFQSLRESIN